MRVQRKRVRRRRLLQFVAAVIAPSIAAVGLVATGAAPPAQAAAGDEVMAIEWEGGASSEPILIQNYVEPGVGGFTADANWLNESTNVYWAGYEYTGNCNGLIVSYDMAVNEGWQYPAQRYSQAECGKEGSGNRYTDFDAGSMNFLRVLAGALGRFDAELSGTTLANEDNHNSVLATYTDQAGPQGPGVMAEMVSPVTVPSGAYYVASVDVGASNCLAPPLIDIRLGTQSQGFTSLMNGPSPVCGTAKPGDISQTYIAHDFDELSAGVDGTSTGNVFVRRIFSDQSLLVDGSNNQWVLQVYNAEGEHSGNDGAVDNIRIVDATPHIVKEFTDPINTVGDTTTLVITVENSADLASKADFELTDNLASGLTTIPGTVATNCGDGTASQTETSVSITGGDLAAGQTDCTITVDVTSTTAGTFTNGPANIVTSSLEPPTETVDVTFNLPSDGPEHETTPFNTPVDIDPFENFVPATGDETPTTPNKDTFQFTPSDVATVSEDGLTATTPDGVFVYNPETGVVTFTPTDGFEGTTPAVPYTYDDSNGNTVGSTMDVTTQGPGEITKDFADPVNTTGDTTVLTITVSNSADLGAKTDFGFVDTLDAGLTTVPGSAATTCGDGTVTLTAGSIELAGGDLAEGAADCVVTVEVTADEAGTFTNGPGNITSDTLLPPTTDVEVTFNDPSDLPEHETTPYNTPVDIDPFENFVPATGDGTPTTPNKDTFQFTPGDDSTVSEDGLTATTPDGVFVYNPETGVVTFTPNDGFVGTTPEVPYTYEDSNGNPVDSFMDVTVLPPVDPSDPTTGVISKEFETPINSVGETTTLTITVTNAAAELPEITDFGFVDTLADGLETVSGTGVTSCGDGTVNLTATSIELIGGDLAAGEANCTVTVSVTSTTAGTYTNGPDNIETDTLVEPETDVEVTFVPPADEPEHAETPYNTPVTIDPFENFVPGPGDETPTTPDPDTFQFTPIDGGEVSEDGHTVVVPDGTFVYDPETGLVTFTPTDGFVGTTPEVPYTYNDSVGTPVDSFMDVTVAPPVLPGGETPTPTPTQPTDEPRLPVTGAEIGIMIPALALLLMGLGVYLVMRRKQS